MKAVLGLSQVQAYTPGYITRTQHTCSGDCMISRIFHYHGGWVHCGSSTGQPSARPWSIGDRWLTTTQLH